MAEKFKKFGLDHCDLPTMLWNVTVILRAGTININRKYLSRPTPWIFYLVIIFTGGCYIYAYGLSLAWFLLFRLPETGDVRTAAVELSLSTASGTCIAKFLYMKLCSNTVMDIVDEYLLCDKLVAKDTRFARNLSEELRKVKKRALTVWVILISNALLYVTLPIFIPGRHFTEDLYVLYGLEPMFETPNYEISFLILVSGVYFAVFTLVHTSMFTIIIVGYLEAAMMSLSEELKHIWDDSEPFYRTVMDIHRINTKDMAKNAYIKYHLENIVKFQIVILKLKNKIDKELSILFIMEIVFLIFAIVTELIGGLENTYLEVPYTCAQVFITCLIGQRLVDASVCFEKSLYDCRWENFNVSNQRMVLLMLRFSQKTMTLSAGGITILSFPCLMFIMKTSYSAYTTLNSSVNKWS